MLSKVQKYISSISSTAPLEALQEACQLFRKGTRAVEARALSTLIYLPGKAFAIIIALAVAWSAKMASLDSTPIRMGIPLVLTEGPFPSLSHVRQDPFGH